jgi:chemotaxis methyl-accepting protein methylase
MNSVDLSKYAQSFLGTSLLNRIAETGRSSAPEYLVFMEQDASERTAFIDSLRISYSKFFRNPLTFAVLEGIVLPSLLLKKSTEKLQ